MIFPRRREALISLVSVMVLGATALLVVLFVVLSSVDLMQQGLDEDEFQETFIGTEACAEEALIRLNSDETYTGDSFTIGNVTCLVLVTGTGSTRTIDIDGNQGSTYYSSIELTVDVSSSPIVITNWEEI